MTKPVIMGAFMSDDGAYRYSLSRTWDAVAGRCMFIGLNPSTADATVDDPTIRRMAGFAHRLGYGGFVVANLFGFRATDPKQLLKQASPIGPDNDAWIKRLLPLTGIVIACWGTLGKYLGRGDAVYQLLVDYSVVPVCLGQTVEGEPSHPLYLRSDTAINQYIRRRTT